MVAVFFSVYDSIKITSSVYNLTDEMMLSGKSCMNIKTKEEPAQCLVEHQMLHQQGYFVHHLLLLNERKCFTHCNSNALVIQLNMIKSETLSNAFEKSNKIASV